MHWPTLFRVAAIFLVFFLFAGGPPPDINEAHYLAKAKHYWNPAWCAGDQFLESADAHQVFNWTFGWLTLLLPLPAVAWVGRSLTWALLALAWIRLHDALLADDSCRDRQNVGTRVLANSATDARELRICLTALPVLTAALFLGLNARFQLAGEWVVGGVEAKGFAYVLVWLGLANLVSGRWPAVWRCLSAATAFHVLVGGWSLLAVGGLWLARLPRVRRFQRPSLFQTLVVVGLIATGLIPALRLTWGQAHDTVREANRIYVLERLDHHLVFQRFSWLAVARFTTLLAAWTAVAMATRNRPRLSRLHGFVAGAVAIAAVGVLLDLTLWRWPDLAAALLRYYWYRLADALLPLGLSASFGVLIAGWLTTRPARGQAAFLLLWLVAVAILGEALWRRQADRRPVADRQFVSTLTATGPQAAPDHYQNWRRLCFWISDHTQPGDRFLTPWRQSTFKWYTGRPEVATWKDVPQDAAEVVEWWRRQRELFLDQPRDEAAASSEDPPQSRLNSSRPKSLRGNVTALSDEQLLELARKYGFRYIVVERWSVQRRLGFTRVYPDRFERNESFEVYRLPR